MSEARRLPNGGLIILPSFPVRLTTEASRDHAAEPIGESARIGWALAVQDASGIKEQVSDVSAQRILLHRRERRDHRMAWVHLEDGLGCTVDPASCAEQAFELTIRAFVRRNKAYRALSQPIGR